jgi:plasmid stabilization system protein ParE
LNVVLPVVVTARAASQIERASQWWADNRPSAPGAVADDFAQAKALLARQPGAGARSASARYPDLRRLYLSRVRYHLYYRQTESAVIVLAFWHASRGAAPVL